MGLLSERNWKELARAKAKVDPDFGEDWACSFLPANLGVTAANRIEA
jgi:hypothetical protein